MEVLMECWRNGCARGDRYWSASHAVHHGWRRIHALGLPQKLAPRLDERLQAGPQAAGHGNDVHAQHAGHFSQGGIARVQVAAFGALHRHAAKACTLGKLGLGHLVGLAGGGKGRYEVSRHDAIYTLNILKEYKFYLFAKFFDPTGARSGGDAATGQARSGPLSAHSRACDPSDPMAWFKVRLTLPASQPVRSPRPNLY